jgi:type IV secretion/conjugal transfer VirB4 family ATPase
MPMFAEHREETERLPDFLPWYALIGPVEGLVLQKDEFLQKSYAFRGPDLASSGMADLVRLSSRINMVLARGGGGWTFFVEVQRLEALDYPSSTWPNAATCIVDRERRRQFYARKKESAALYESFYFITFVWRLPGESQKKLTRIFFENAERDVATADANRDIEFFLRSLEEMTDLLVGDGGLKELIELDDQQTLTYLHSTVSRNRQTVIPSEGGLYLDAYLPDQALTCGDIPMLGEWYMPTAVITEFPASTRPGIFAQLDSLGFEYRLVWRWQRLSKEDATKEIENRRRGFWAKRKGLKKTLKEEAGGAPSALLNNAAISKSHDAAAALEALAADLVAFGRMTCTLTTWDTDYRQAREKMRALKQVIQTNGFLVRDEAINSLEAWLGSLPGKTNANVRDYVVSSINLAHMIPATAVWSGDECNEHIVKITGQRESHIYCTTDGTNQFRLNTNVGDLGHTLVIGPPGSGKSVLMVTLAMQWARYHAARVIIFDKDRSARAATMAVGGSYYEPGREDAPVAFQPLARIDEPAERAWAAQFILSLLAAQGYRDSPAMKEVIDHTLEVIAQKPPRQRRLFHFVDQLGDPTLAQVLRPYTIAGHYGKIFDGDHEDIQASSWLMIEMAQLMGMGDAVIVPALAYLFHRIEGTLNGELTLLILDEAWLFLQHAVFQSRLKDWLKTLRKKNVYVIFATQEVADAVGSPIMPTILTACQTRIILPDPQASVLSEGYRKLNLSDAEIAHIEQLEKKRHYFYVSPKGRRVFSLDHEPVGLAFAGMAAPSDQVALDNIAASVPQDHYAEMILRHRGLDEAADEVAAMVASGGSQFAS